eukprot:3485209-Rhodomonas_salina.1
MECNRLTSEVRMQRIARFWAVFMSRMGSVGSAGRHVCFLYTVATRTRGTGVPRGINVFGAAGAPEPHAHAREGGLLRARGRSALARQGGALHVA